MRGPRFEHIDADRARSALGRARGPRFACGMGMLLGAFAVAGGCAAQTESRGPGITAVEGLKLGHHTLEGRPTGCTVILAEDGAVAGVDVRGGAPGTRDIALLDPVATIERVHGIALSGGSAFGLDVATGVVRFLEERGVGVAFGGSVIPIVPTAILFDLGVGDGSIRPGPACGYAAASIASTDAMVEGSVGAGAGATVGKLAGRDRAMKGGIGTASITLADGLTVAAVVAVNAVGDIVDPATGRIVAGARTPDGTGFTDARALLREGAALEPGAGANTTIGVVATNASLTKTQVTKIAQMAHDGFARAIYPAHTPSDGDTVFGLATGTHEGDVSVTRLGALAADVTAEAILRAVRTATGIPGFPAASELDRTP